MNKTPSMILFALVALLIVVAVHYYFWMRLVRDTGIGAPWRQIATSGIILLGAAIPFAMIVGREAPFELSRNLVYGPYIWMGMMLLLIFALGVTDLVKLVAFIGKKLSGGNGPLIVDESRRGLMAKLVAGGAFAAAGGLTAVAAVKGKVKASVVSRTISLSKLPVAAEGLKIVQISDLHIGVTDGREWARDLVERVNALEPDVIAVTGDMIDGTPSRLMEQVNPLVGLKARLGVYAVTGNHEYYSGVEEWVPAFEGLGMKVLRNESVEIADGLLLAGVDDYNSKGMAPGHGPDLSKALKNRRTDQEVVLLAHQPREIEQAAKNDVGLMLAGHTHGGQIWPFTMLVGLQQPYNKGFYEHNERTAIYVNQGTGTWGPPMRLGSHGEITEITLKRG